MTRSNPGALGLCLMALFRDDDSVDARAGAFALAEFINLVRSALKSK